MSELATETSVRAKARWVGVFEIFEGLTATYGQVIVLNKLIVSGNAAATAANVLDHEPLFRLGFASCVFGIGFHIAWALLFYQLFKLVNRNVASFGLLIIVVGCGIQAVAAIFYVAPLLVLTAGSSLKALTSEQLQAIAFALFKINGAANNGYLVFFGVWCAVSGYLIFKSRFLPRVLGLLLALDGLAWMTYLAPPFANKLFPVVAVISALAELPLPWFFIFGFNTRRWMERATEQA